MYPRLTWFVPRLSLKFQSSIHLSRDGISRRPLMCAGDPTQATEHHSFQYNRNSAQDLDRLFQVSVFHFKLQCSSHIKQGSPWVVIKSKSKWYTQMAVLCASLSHWFKESSYSSVINSFVHVGNCWIPTMLQLLSVPLDGIIPSCFCTLRWVHLLPVYLQKSNHIKFFFDILLTKKHIFLFT